MALAAALVSIASPGYADDVPVTLSDYPRIIKRDLPKVQPGQELKLGILRLHPSFQTQVEYDDNVRLTPNNEEEDVIFKQEPGILGRIRAGNHRFDLGYLAEIINFADDEEENAVNHLVNGNANLNFGPLSIRVTDLMEDSTSRLFNEDSSRDRLMLNTAEARARYEMTHWVLEGGYKNNIIDYKRAASGNNNDRDENIYSLLLGNKVATKSTVFVEGNVGEVNYDNSSGNADHDFWQAFVGFTYRSFFEKWDDAEDSMDRSLNQRVNATVKIGFENRQLGDVPGRTAAEEFQGAVADASIQYRFNLYESASLGYTRSVNVSTFGINEWYQTDRFAGSFKKRLLKKLYIIPRVSYQMQDYPELHTIGTTTDRRDDDLWNTGAELRYEPRVDETTGVAWAWASLFYTYRDRASNFDTLDFENNKFGVKIGFAY